MLLKTKNGYVNPAFGPQPSVEIPQNENHTKESLRLPILRELPPARHCSVRLNQNINPYCPCPQTLN
jgi:hypothetical protein